MASTKDRRVARSFTRELGEAVLAAAADGVFACDRDGQITACNGAGAGFLRMAPSRVTGAELRRLLGRLGDETLELRFVSAIRDDSIAEFVVERPGGEDEWIEVRALPIESGMVFLLKDVTDRERSERELRRKERRFRIANESLRLAHYAAKAASWEWRWGGPLRWLDPAAARALVGFTDEQAANEAIADWRSFVAPEDMPVVDAALQSLQETGEAIFEYRVAGADGRHWLRSSAAVVERRSDGAPARVAGVTLDVTPHKEANAALQREVQERQRAEQRQQLLIHELNHRVKNMLATVQSVARQSLGRPRSGGGPLADFEERLMALAWTHDVLTSERWAGASLAMILDRTLAPHARAERIALEGPDLRVSPKMVLALAMGAHELVTNAVKYGALSNDTGTVTVRWSLQRDRLVLDWREAGGPPVEPPKTRGFGSRLLERGLAHELGGEVTMEFAREGLRCRISAPFQPEAGDELTGPFAGETGSQPPAPH